MEGQWVGGSPCLVGVLRLCGGLAPVKQVVESSAVLSQGLCVEAVRKRESQIVEGGSADLCSATDGSMGDG